MLRLISRISPPLSKVRLGTRSPRSRPARVGWTHDQLMGHVFSNLGGPRGAAWTLFLLALSCPVLAHDLSIQISLAPPAVVTRAVYGAGEPVVFGKVLVYAPGAPAKVYQSGNADEQGYFCFRPAGPGNWRVAVDDELGHRQESVVRIPEPFAGSTSQASASGASRLERAALGLALIIGISGFWYGFRARRG